MGLKEEIKSLSGNRRKFFLLRIADMDTKAALKLCGVVRGTYNTWCQNSEFVELYRRRDELAGDYRQEAIRLLRRDNQLEAVLLEGKVLAKIKDELDSGEYELIRTHLAREVYSKLIADLDYQPKALALTWEQRIQQIFGGNAPKQIVEGEITNAEPETNSQQETEESTNGET